MVLELKPEELNRLDDLLSNEWRGKRPYIARPSKVTITAEQVIEVKHRLTNGQAIINITRDTGNSRYHILGVRRGIYDFLLE